jgi:putative transposase
MVTDKLRSYEAAKRELMPGVEHRRHRGSTTGRRTRISRRDDENGR